MITKKKCFHDIADEYADLARELESLDGMKLTPKQEKRVKKIRKRMHKLSNLMYP